MTTKQHTLDEIEKIIGPMTFGRLLESLRTTAEITQVDMAKKLGISKQELCDIEKSRKTISLERAIKFARKLKESEEAFVHFALEDQLRRAGIKAQIKIKSVA